MNHSVGSVTGRTYKRTRVRGSAPYRPRRKGLALIESVRTIIAEYDMALSVRQIFYRLVGKYNYEKTEQAYDQLGEYLNRARRAGLIAWDAIRDDGDVVPGPPGWSNVEDFWAAVEGTARNYWVAPKDEIYVELWCEAAGMAPQLQAVAQPFGVRVIASSGFSSVTAHRAAAQRLAEQDRPVVIVMVGDYDPSGQSIMDSGADDVQAFGHEIGALFEFEQLAVTERQASAYELISKPQKATDRRGEYMGETYQAEALDPAVLSVIVEARLSELIGEAAIQRATAQSERDREAILGELGKLRR